MQELNIIDTARTLIAGIISGVIVYFDPVAGKIESLLALFLVNFIVGYLTGKIMNKESFDMHKFKDCFFWGAVILVIICAFYFIGEHNGDKEGTIECLHVTILVAIWAFGTNILRNLCMLSRDNEPVHRFFYACFYWLSFEFVTQIPWLAGLVKGRDQAEEETPEDNDSTD